MMSEQKKLVLEIILLQMLFLLGLKRSLPCHV